MKKYNKILEAINRGINLALDDFDDEHDLIGQQTETIKDINYTKEYLDLMNEVVDLGLPSGTLWCKYNLGVDPNLLSKDEDWIGDYYAWGELEGNKTKYSDIYFNLDNYKFNETIRKHTFADIEEQHITKYSEEDNLTKLLPEDDVAYLNKKLHNFKFHIPTKELCEELKNYTTNYWVYNYDPNKLVHNPKNDGGIQWLHGRVFEGKNGKLLFIPAAGCHLNFASYNIGSCCYLWSSSLVLHLADNAWSYYICSNDIGMYTHYRYYGYSIRPVINL